MGLRKSRAIKHPSPFGLFAWRMHMRSRGLANKYVTCDIYCSSKSGTFPPQETFSILPERVLTFVCWIIMLCILFLYASPEVMSLCYWHVLIPAPLSIWYAITLFSLPRFLYFLKLYVKGTQSAHPASNRKCSTLGSGYTVHVGKLRVDHIAEIDLNLTLYPKT